MEIKIVPHPNKYHVKTPDGKRGLYWCEPCQERTAEPFDRPHYRPVKCDKCKQPCSGPVMDTTWKDQMGVAVDGAVVAYCKAEPDGWMASCQATQLSDYWRAEIKALVDKTYGGDAVWTDGSLVGKQPGKDEEAEADIDEDEEEEEDE